MNITFLVGNGFDINLGLKTRYTDFYPTYLSKGHQDILSKAILANYKNWADLEVALGTVLKQVNYWKVDDFLKSKTTLEKDLADYLRKQEDLLDLTNPDLPGEFQRNVVNFFKEFPRREQEAYNTWLSSVNSPINYGFISYNYTACLDRIIKKCRTLPTFSEHMYGNTVFTDTLGDVHHVHGTLDEDLILGVDNESQICNPTLRTHPQLQKCIVKFKVNRELGEQRTEHAQRIIDRSDYIGIYGMSLGDTDLMWWKYLIRWLHKKPSRRLILYIYPSSNPNPSGQEKVRLISEWKDYFLNKSGTNASQAEQLRNQIIVVLRSKIFNFNSISLT